MAKPNSKPKAIPRTPAAPPPGLSVAELASRLNVSPATARKWAMTNHYALRHARRGPKVFDLSRDDSPPPAGLSVAALARLLNVSRPTAQRWASANGYVLGKQGRLRKPAENLAANRPPWSTVDWSLRDTEIARRIGKSRERVRQMRLQLGRAMSITPPHGWTRIRIVVQQEPDGRWKGTVAGLAGVAVDGDTRDRVIANTKAAALRMLAQQLEAQPLTDVAALVFSVTA